MAETAAAPVPVELERLGRIAGAVIAVFLAAFLVWAALAQLDAGALAPGEVIPSGKLKTVQHLEGGIIERIFVVEGENVRQGQPLMHLQETEARALVAIAETERAALEALLARLVAERDGAPAGALKRTGNISVDNQTRLFEQRRQALAREMAGVRARIDEARQERKAWQTRGDVLAQSLEHHAENLAMNERLVEQNFVARPRILELKTREAETRATMEETRAETMRAQSRISEGETALEKLRADWMTAVLEDLRKAQESLAAAREREAVGRDRLARTTIVAPQDGRVQALRYTTVGGVVPPNGAVMDVIPEKEDLVVEARVSPDDIDVVHKGLHCRVRLTAYRPRTHVALHCRVLQVSADAVRDERMPGRTWYTARVAIEDDAGLKKQQMTLVPGMQAQVEIITGSRSVLRYLVDPVLDSARRAFWEI